MAGRLTCDRNGGARIEGKAPSLQPLWIFTILGRVGESPQERPGTLDRGADCAQKGLSRKGYTRYCISHFTSLYLNHPSNSEVVIVLILEMNKMKLRDTKCPSSQLKMAGLHSNSGLIIICTGSLDSWETVPPDGNWSDLLMD